MRAGLEGVVIRTKLIATLGPASASRERLVEMFHGGLDVARLNFSHGTPDQHKAAVDLVRRIAAERGAPICIIGDLGGPKIRLGTFPDGPVTIVPGQSVRLVRGSDPCTPERLTASYARLVDDAAIGHRVYIDDGLVRLLVTDKRNDELLCTCTTGGTLSDHKGVNLPDTRLSVATPTDKDRRDLDWAIANALEYVALSFVREPEQVYELKRLIKERGGELRVVVKIEKREALEHLDELIAAADAVMVARGDLGVEMEMWRVPLVQKELVARCQEAGVPVIVATQMLQSMVTQPAPTRAEVSDVANAILDRVDAVMLSAETAVGQYPAQAVDFMNRIAAATEEYMAARWTPEPAAPSVSVRARPTGAVAHAAVQAARDLDARVVAVWTATGKTVRMVAKHRLPMPVVGLTCQERVYREMNLLYGVVPILVDPMDNPVQMAQTLDSLLLDRRLASPGDLVVVVTSTRPQQPGATDTTLVHRVGGG